MTSQLRDLADLTVIELRPPVVVLDASKSVDGQDVLARLGRAEGVPQGPCNFMLVPTGNSIFRTRGVMPGDVVKYFIRYEGEYEREFGQQSDDAFAVDDIVSVKSIDMIVEQVVGESGLIVAPGLPFPIAEPFRIEVWRYVDDYEQETRRKLALYSQRGVPLVGWEPSPDATALEQIVQRLNQWARQSEPTIAWKPPALLATLPTGLIEHPKLQPFLSEPSLQRVGFMQPTPELQLVQGNAYEGRLLAESLWARDLAAWLTSGIADPAAKVERLFDWVTRSVQLEPVAEAPPRRPWQSLLLARGTANQRAWVFAALARQIDVPVVAITVPLAKGRSHLWCGAFVGGQLRLYDPLYGLPIANAEGTPATLAEVVSDPALLARLDSPALPYPVTSELLSGLRVGVIADPFDISRRAAWLESRLAGDDRMRIATPVDAIAAQLRGVLPDSIPVELWSAPFEMLLAQLELNGESRYAAAIGFQPFTTSPRLWKARALHFRGRKGDLSDQFRQGVEDRVDDHRAAAALLMHPSVRPTDRQLQRIADPETARNAVLAKAQATYWLGLLALDEKEPDTALQWFKSLAESESPLVREMWRAGVRGNRATVLTELGDPAAAKRLLEAAPKEQFPGDHVRAARLPAPQP